MRDGFVKVAALTPNVVVADPAANIKDMIIKAEEMAAVGVKLLVFPELSVTGYTCGDLFLTDTLLAGAKDALYDYLYKTAELDIVSILGMPIEHGGRIYNAAVVVSGGEYWALFPRHLFRDTMNISNQDILRRESLIWVRSGSVMTVRPLARHFCFRIHGYLSFLFPLRYVTTCGCLILRRCRM